jgi:uncharacterized membrane protein
MRGLTDLPTRGAALPQAGSTIAVRSRLDAIDLVRGVVMVIMALDHVRDYFSNLTIDPVDMQHTSWQLFLTRWVTHFCAPTFVFLAGTGSFLFGARCQSTRQLSWFLFSRGVWLVFLEITLVRLGWNFNFDYQGEFGGGVIWVIGWAMVLMSVLVFLPTSAVAVIGVGLVAFHNLLDGRSAEQVGLPKSLEGLWVVLHSPGRFQLFDSFQLGPWEVPAVHFGTGYCLLPWLGVLAAGYGFGALFLLEQRVRRPQLLGLGLALTALFIVLRYANVYGDNANAPPGAVPGRFPGPWAPQKDGLFTVFSFLNCQKYPPSLLYALMTLGPAITCLGIFDRPVGAIGRIFVTFGRVPLFYYLLHIPLIHGLMVAGDYLRFGSSPFAAGGPWNLDRAKMPPDYGYDLPVVYLVWLGVVVFLYPLCYWYAGVKARYKSGWLSYL